MAEDLFSFSSFGIQSSCFDLQDAVTNGKNQDLFGGRENERKLGVYNSIEEEDYNLHWRGLESKSVDSEPEELNFTSVFEDEHQVFDEVPSREQVKPATGLQASFMPLSLELLRNFKSGLKKLKVDDQIGSTEVDFRGGKKRSTEEITRIAGARYVQFSDSRYDDFSMVMHPFGHALTGLSDEETKDVELVHLLLAAAEKVGYHQFERASRLLSRCEWIASEGGNPVERVVYYFAEALRERIDKETGCITRSKGLKSRAKNEIVHGLSTNITSVAYYQKLPFLQVLHFAGIQAIVENVASSTKVHVIDIEIRSGVQWTMLMQALSEREEPRIELLKITAFGLESAKDKIEKTGQWLVSFAESLNLPFSFNAVYVQAMEDVIKEEEFKTKCDESVVVFAPLILRTMVSTPSCLDNLMRLIKCLKPCIMVVIEVEANHNSPSFVNRFLEALFFYSSYFDCLESSMAEDVELRMKIESVFYNGIRNIVALEGKERIVRSVKMDVWRVFFSRFKMVELGFSEAAFYQANLVLKRFPCSTSYMIDKNGKSVIVGWKGTPIHSLSAWKFARDRGRSFGNYKILN